MASFVKRRGPGGKTVWPARVERKGWPRQYATFDTKAGAEKWASVIELEISRDEAGGIQGVRVLEICDSSSRNQRTWDFKYSDPLNWKEAAQPP